MATGNGRLNDLEHNKVVNGTWTGDYTVGTGGHLLLIMSYNSFLYTGVFIATVHNTYSQLWLHTGPTSATLAKHWADIVVYEESYRASPYMTHWRSQFQHPRYTLGRCCSNVEPASATLAQHWINIDPTYYTFQGDMCSQMAGWHISGASRGVDLLDSSMCHGRS